MTAKTSGRALAIYTYIKRIKNSEKQAFARDYLAAWGNDATERAVWDSHRNLSYMAKQAVMHNLSALLS